MLKFKTCEEAQKYLKDFFQSGKSSFPAEEIEEKKEFIEACKLLYLTKNGIDNDKVDLTTKPILVNGVKISSASGQYENYDEESEEFKNGKIGKISFDEDKFKDRQTSAYRLMFLTFHELQHCVQTNKIKTYDAMYSYYNDDVRIGEPSQTGLMLNNPKFRDKCPKPLFNKIFNAAWAASPNEIDADTSALDFINECTQGIDMPREFKNENLKHKCYTKYRHSVSKLLIPSIEKLSKKFNQRQIHKQTQDKSNELDVLEK